MKPPKSYCLFQSAAPKSLGAKTARGFTLVELMITIVIVGLLTAIALPTYINQQSKARATCAVIQVSALAKEQQIHFTQNSQFASDYTTLGSTQPEACGGYNRPTLSSSVIDASPTDTTNGLCVRATLANGSFKLIKPFKGICGAG